MATASTESSASTASVTEERTHQDGEDHDEKKEKSMQTESRSRRSQWYRRKASAPAPAPTSIKDAKLIPEASASFLSKLTFQWITPMMVLGNKRILQKEDLWKIDEANSGAQVLSEKVMAAYERRTVEAREFNERLRQGEIPPRLYRWRDWTTTLAKGQKSGFHWPRYRSNAEREKRASLVYALNDTFFYSFWRGGIYKVVGDVLQVTSPLLSRAIITYGSETYYGLTQSSVGHGVGLAVGLLVMMLVSTFCQAHFFKNGMEVGVLARGALISTIFKKAVRLSGKSKAKFSNGRLVTAISTDVSRIDFTAGFFHFIWTAPIQVLVVLIILIVEIGAPAAFAGMGFLFVVAPMQSRAMRRLFRKRAKSLKFTDSRVRLVQEILSGMKVIKFFAWESPFLKKLAAIRNTEVKYIRQLLITRAAINAVALTLPTLASVVAFSVYAAVGNQGQGAAATIFTSLTLFQMLRIPLMFYPMVLGTIIDARVALKRLEDLLDAEELQSTFTSANDDLVTAAEKAEHDVVVKDAAFDWDGGEATAPEDVRGKAKKKDKSKKSAKREEARMLNAEKRDEAARPGDTEVIANEPTPAVAPIPQLASSTKEAGNDEEDEVLAGLPVLAKEAASSSNLPTLSHINFRVKKGSLVAVVGPVGCGKSSLLQGLVGEMKFMHGSVYFGGSLSYCPQSAWIQNDTVINNITFGRPWDEERFWNCVHDACLEPDLLMLPDGAQTQIGERGITLSGGQKQRLSIARALYYNADVVLLDDPLSAVDAHVGRFLMDHAIKGRLAGRTRVLVTHQLHFLPETDYIYVMRDGRFTEQGTYEELAGKSTGEFAALVREFGGRAEEKKEIEDDDEAKAIDDTTKLLDSKEAEGGYALREKMRGGQGTQLMQDEERETGSVGFNIFGEYFKAAGWWVVPFLPLSLGIMQGSSIMSGLWLSFWTAVPQKYNEGNGFYLGIYAAIGVMQAVGSFLMGVSFAVLSTRASANLHNSALERLIRAPMSWFDTTPLGRIMNRVSKDVDVTDNLLSDSLRMLGTTLSQVLGSVILVEIEMYYFFAGFLPILLLYAFAAKFYRRSARELKRLDSLLRSYLYAHFSESLSGLATIRAYHELPRILNHNDELIDLENRAYYLTTVNQRWLGLRLDVCGALILFVVALISVLDHSISPSQIGLVLTYTLLLSQTASFLVRQLAETENNANSVERLCHYKNNLEQEAPEIIPQNEPDSSWPSRGEIRFSNVEMNYRPGLPLVLKGITATFQAGERVGVIGRTGAGKSSIMTALYRMVEISNGSITIDGIDISTVGLKTLRRGMAIIPQDPILFNGTIRTNLDPFNQHTDHELWHALRRSWLVDVKSPESRQSMTEELPSHNSARGSVDSAAGETHRKELTLDSVVEDEGQNLSQGTRQLVSLARALVRNSQIVVLDEATSSVDLDTDNKIQGTIVRDFRGKTMLTIAHRLRTIIGYDKILVMDQGRVAEFGAPLELEALSDGIFSTMCRKSRISRDDIILANREVHDSNV